MNRLHHSSNAPPYAEIVVASNFSFLHGASHADELVAQAKALGLSAISIADHNTLAGIVRAHVAAREFTEARGLFGAGGASSTGGLAPADGARSARRLLSCGGVTAAPLRSLLKRI